jgi:chromosome segregation ATPase
MQAVDLITGYAEKLKNREKQLKSLEKRSKALSQNHAETEAERYTLEEQITDHQRDTAALLSEREDLHLSFMTAVYEQDALAQEKAQARRAEIDTALEDHEQALEELGKSLGELPSCSQESAELAAEIDALALGNASKFARELDTVLINNQMALEARQADARLKLPEFDRDTYHQYRLTHDAVYAQQKEGEELQANRIAHKLAENERRYGKPGDVPKQAVVNDEGYLVGYR